MIKVAETVGFPIFSTGAQEKTMLAWETSLSKKQKTNKTKQLKLND